MLVKARILYCCTYCGILVLLSPKMKLIPILKAFIMLTTDIKGNTCKILQLKLFYKSEIKFGIVENRISATQLVI